MKVSEIIDELDVEQFWKDDAEAHRDNCFYEASPQVALGIRMSGECVFAELGEEGNPWGRTPRERRIELNRRYNDKAEKIVGKRLLNENFPPEDAAFPPIREIGELFGGRYVFNGESTWLLSDVRDEKTLEKTLAEAEDIIQNRFREFVLPPGWDSEKRRIYETYGRKHSLYGSVRGPVTLATSIYGVENLIFLILDNPPLAARFSEAILRALIAYSKLFIAEAGYTTENFPHGFSFADDDCCLLTPDMYKTFAYPILKGVFDFASPLHTDYRYQHSDSAMSHLLPILADFNLTGCNFGPTVTVREIRRFMPATRIDGQLAPFTFMRNDPEAIAAEVRRDCEMIRESGVKGLNLTTAGSINNGSLLTSMRTVMSTIQRYGRYGK